MPSPSNSPFDFLTEGVRDIKLYRTVFVVESPTDLTEIDVPSESGKGRVHVVRISGSPDSVVAPRPYVEKLKFWIQNQLNTRACLLQFQTLYLDSTESQLTIFTEQHDGDILEYIARNPNCDRFVLLRDLLTGLDFLHQRNFIHGDIRPGNTFMKSNGKCYFGDFSPTRAPTKESLLSEPWLAPELFNPDVIYNAFIDGWRDYHGEFTKESDLFAFGCLAVQVYAGELPILQRFPTDKRLDWHAISILRRCRSSQELDRVPIKMQPVVNCMLAYLPKQRRTSTELMKSLWVKDTGHYLKVTANVPEVMAKSQMRRLWHSGYL